MFTLLNDQFAPVTSSLAFISRPLNDVADYLAGLHNRHYKSVSQTRLAGTLAQLLPRLEPLSIMVSKELLVQSSAPEWTALFTSSPMDDNRDATLRYLSEGLGCLSVLAQAVPNTMNKQGIGRWGGVQFRTYGPEPLPGEILNYIRTVACVNDGGRWVFETFGEPYDFEDTENYTQRIIRKRFTSSMLVDYCAAFGLHPFEEDFYSKEGQVVTHLKPRSGPIGKNIQKYTIAQAQQRSHITPGEAATYRE